MKTTTGPQNHLILVHFSTKKEKKKRAKEHTQGPTGGVRQETGWLSGRSLLWEQPSVKLERGGMQDRQSERDYGLLTFPNSMTPGLSNPPQLLRKRRPNPAHEVWGWALGSLHPVKEELLSHPQMTYAETMSESWVTEPWGDPLVREANPTWLWSEPWPWAEHLRLPTWKTRWAGEGS